MNCPYKVKVCTKCKRILIACEMNFKKQRNGKYNLASQCKVCEKKYRKENKEYYAEYHKQYYEKNKEQLKENKKQYYEENKQEIKEYQKQYREENKQELSEYFKQYREENKEQIAEKQKQYYEEHKEQIKEQKKQYYEENKEQIKENSKQYYEENKEYYAEYKKQYREKNPHIQFNAHNRRRSKEENQGSGITKEQWLEMMLFFDFKCAYSGEYIGRDSKYRTIDHIVALDNGGLNEIWNCVPMYKSYNTSKYTKDMEQWYRQQDFFSEDRLVKIYTWIEYAYNKWSKKRRKGNKKNSNII